MSSSSGTPDRSCPVSPADDQSPMSLYLLSKCGIPASPATSTDGSSPSSILSPGGTIVIDDPPKQEHLSAEGGVSPTRTFFNAPAAYEAGGSYKSAGRDLGQLAEWSVVLSEQERWHNYLATETNGETRVCLSRIETPHGSKVQMVLPSEATPGSTTHQLMLRETYESRLEKQNMQEFMARCRFVQ